MLIIVELGIEKRVLVRAGNYLLTFEASPTLNPLVRVWERRGPTEFLVLLIFYIFPSKYFMSLFCLALMVASQYGFI